MPKEVVIANLWRFGYDLTCVTETEAEAEALLRKEYRRAFRNMSGGVNPAKSEVDDAMTYIEYHHMKTNTVEWR